MGRGGGGIAGGKRDERLSVHAPFFHASPRAGLGLLEDSEFKEMERGLSFHVAGNGFTFTY